MPSLWRERRRDKTVLDNLNYIEADMHTQQAPTRAHTHRCILYIQCNTHVKYSSSARTVVMGVRRSIGRASTARSTRSAAARRGGPVVGGVEQLVHLLQDLWWRGAVSGTTLSAAEVKIHHH